MGADVFISYKRTDLDRVQPIADALQAKGLTVWYDARLEAGSSFDAEITKELRAAKAVLVCWSKESVESEWVRAEATEGRQRGALVSCLLEPCNPYPPFNLIHHEDLADWKGQEDHVGWRRLVAAVGARVSRGDLAADVAPRPAQPPAKKPARGLAIVLGAVAAACVALIGLGAAVLFTSRAPQEAPPQAAVLSPSPAEPAPQQPPPQQPAPDQAQPPADAAQPPQQQPPAEPAQRPRPELSQFVMLGPDEPRFGTARRHALTMRFDPDVHRSPQDARAVMDGLVARFAQDRVEGLDITAPAVADEVAAELRDRRIAALVAMFTRRGMPPSAIAIQYAANPESLDTFDLTLYWRPAEE